MLLPKVLILMKHLFEGVYYSDLNGGPLNILRTPHIATQVVKPTAPTREAHARLVSNLTDISYMVLKVDFCLKNKGLSQSLSALRLSETRQSSNIAIGLSTKSSIMALASSPVSSC